MFDNTSNKFDKFIRSFVQNAGYKMQSIFHHNLQKIVNYTSIKSFEKINTISDNHNERTETGNFQSGLKVQQMPILLNLQSHPFNQNIMKTSQSLKTLQVLYSKNIKTKIVKEICKDTNLKQFLPIKISNSLPQRCNKISKKDNFSEEDKSEFVSVQAPPQDHSKAHNKIQGNESFKHSLSAGLVEHIDNESKIYEKYVQLHANDATFFKNNVHVGLYILLTQDEFSHGFRISKSRRQQIILHCRQAILILIEPSEKTVVQFERNLSRVRDEYMQKGYSYHFNPLSDSEHFMALLVLNEWSSILVKDPSSILLRTLGWIIGCDSQKILVLTSYK